MSQTYSYQQPQTRGPPSFPRHPEPDPAAELEKRLGIAGLWPLAPDEWDDGTFYGLVEVYRDLVSRPRERHCHDYASCGVYSHFSATAGREVCRWKANELLQAAGISYRLADSGENQGRLVAGFDNGRSAPLAEVLGSRGAQLLSGVSA
jgi:hypothetical protein